ncbi:MAG TPA: hypothetical protein VN700_19845 [Vicinamibacterales bacterium]|nr:hypothetical protein [Vicinamibacterales bacterium]
MTLPSLPTLRNALLERRNSDGGWGYSAGRTSRLEPTCWALLALSKGAARPGSLDVLLKWPIDNGWRIDVPGAPVNYAFNALAALTLLTSRDGRTEATQVATRLLDVRGLKFPQGKEMRQDNSLQAWSWIDGTFSWIEPTCLCLLLAKKLRRDLPAAAVADRIDIGERVLLDRACSAGGWNYGGSNVYGQELFPYVPTTALGLIAMQDRASDAIVHRALEWLRKDAASERSAHSMSLAAIALGVHASPLPALIQSLTDHVKTIAPDAGVVGLAASLYALSGSTHGEDAFRL